jgi:hypothetical protein
MNLLSGTTTDHTAVWTSKIWNPLNWPSGEDYHKRLSWALASEFLVGELMKRSRYFKPRSMRNTFKTVHKRMTIKNTSNSSNVNISYGDRK